MTKRLLLLWVAASSGLFGQTTDHVHWTLETPAAVAPGSKFVTHLRATVDPEWHVYSLTTPPGPIPTTVKLKDDAAIAKYRVLEPKPDRKFDPNFQADTETYSGSADFLIEITLKPGMAPGALPVEADVRYQVCSSTSCIPPVRRQAASTVMVAAGAAQASVVIPADYRQAPLTAVSATAAIAAQAGVAPVSDSPWIFFVTAFGFGLAAIFTPCVFPMIPITVSFFLGQNAAGVTSRGASLKQALLFCAGIIVLFSAMGLIATSLLGPFGVVQLGSNVWVNALISVIFLVFGLSLLGAYEITIPSFILNKLDSASRGGGVAGTLLMGLTFSLASFACVGPFVGTLLAASVEGGSWRPLAGMATFATGLSLPFFFLAAFPSFLKKLPRSGGWLARVKVVMGFVIIAAALKYVASIDQVLQWGFLTRERFLAAWIVLFATAGLYLLGFVRLEGVKPDESLGMTRLFAGMLLVIFAVTLIPGMFGGRLGELEGFVPPPSAGSSLGGGSDMQLLWLKNDFQGAIAKARAENKRVLVNFTGYACTNCHWMKQNMFTRPEIAGVLHNMVLVDLYTDAEDAGSQANQQLEQNTFHTIAIPFYVIYDPGAAGSEPKVVATFPSLTRDAHQYLAFLNTPGAVEAAAPVQASAMPVSAGTGSAPLPGVKTLDGGDLDHRALTGKVVVANFWATWCVPCRKEIPEFNQLQSALGSRGLEVVGISLDDGASVVRPFLTKNPIHYTLGLASQQTKDLYKLEELLPVTVVFDRRGQVVDRFEGLTTAEKIRAAAEKAL